MWQMISMRRLLGLRNICQLNEILPFEFSHFEAVSKLPYFHNDPFDRMIIAQAITEDITVITHDAHFRAYGIKVVWA
jgi:PIN domain nuclease of toxin-antitoxin system